MKRHPLIWFFVITFAITWGLGFGIVIFGDTLAEHFGEFSYDSVFWKIIFHVAVYAPAIAAFTVIGVVKGGAGIRSYIGRIFKWRVRLRWYLFVLLGFPLMFLAARLLMIALGREVPGYGFDTWWGWLPYVLLALVNDPGGVEELGWRGFALPMLQRRFSALNAAVILGVIWGVWHVPSFLISGTSQNAMSLPIFLVGSVTLSVLIAVIYNGTGGSVLLCFLTHGMVNSTTGYFVGSGMMYTTVVMALVAIVLVLILGAKNLGTTKVTEPLDIPWDEHGADD
jgi:membrane protease YdiL (CAAX protease family)